MKVRSSIVPILALLSFPVFAKTVPMATQFQAKSKDCVAGIDACFPRNGCINVLGGSRYLFQEHRDECKSGGKDCYDAKCYSVEFLYKNCEGPHERIVVDRKACGKKPWKVVEPVWPL